MKRDANHTLAAAAFTTLILEVFRLNGQLLFTGDQLVKPEKLTSARWQVLGAINIAGQPLSVAQIGRRMGLSRQAVQRIANDLQKLGFVAYAANPDHKRAKLVMLTSRGHTSLERVEALQVDWANAVSRGMDAAQMEEAVNLLRDLQKRCKTTSVPQREQ